MTPRHIEWENETASWQYPLAADTTVISDSGESLPANLLTDLLVYYATEDTQPVLKLSSVRVSPALLSVAISAYDTSGTTPVSRGLLTLTIPRGEFEPYRPYPMDPLRPGVGGIITFGDISWPSTPVLYLFGTLMDGQIRAQLDDSVVRVFEASHITKIVDANSGDALTGIVELSLPDIVAATITKTPAGYNVTLSLTQQGNQLLATVCNAGTSATACGTPIVQSINGVSPNDQGEILIKFA